MKSTSTSRFGIFSGLSVYLLIFIVTFITPPVKGQTNITLTNVIEPGETFNPSAGVSITLAPGFWAKQGCIFNTVLTSGTTPIGATFENPIVVNFTDNSFSQTVNNDPSNNYGNDYGFTSDDIYFRFTIAEASDVEISLCGSDVYDTYLYLLDETGTLIAENDDDAHCPNYRSYLNLPLDAGTYYVVVEGFENNIGNISLQLNLNLVEPVPVITGPFISSGNKCEEFSVFISAENNPLYFDASGLPAGLNIENYTGEIYGTPEEAGTFNVTLAASNNAGTVTASLAMTINDTPLPDITSPLTLGGRAGEELSYQITATNASSYNAAGLPPGISVNTEGLISGVPLTSGPWDAQIMAFNNCGATIKTLVINIEPSLVPVITSPLSSDLVLHYHFDFPLTASNNPTSFNVTGILPQGLVFQPVERRIYGVPTETGTFTVTISAANEHGTGFADLRLNVLPVPEPEPVELFVSHYSATSAVLSWEYSPSSNIVYTIERKSSPLDPNPVIWEVNSTDWYYIDEGLLTGHPYYYKIRARDISSTVFSVWSESVVFTPGPVAEIEIAGSNLGCIGFSSTYELVSNLNSCSGCPLAGNVWSVTGGTITSSDDYHATVIWNEFPEHTISATATYDVSNPVSGDFFSETYYYELSVDVSAYDPMNYEIIGESMVFKGKDYTYSLSNAAKGTGFSWNLTSYAGSIIAGLSTSNITARIGTSPGTLAVTFNDACGASKTASKAIIPRTYKQDDLVVSIYPQEDADVYSYGPNQNLGYSQSFTGARYPNGPTFRGLMKFDLSSIPEGSEIVSAFLYLTQTSHFSGSSNSFELRRIASDWTESIVTWNNMPPIAADNIPIQALNVSNGYVYQINMMSLVTPWFYHEFTNFGAMFKLVDETSFYGMLTFASSDHPDAPKRPRLVITYSVPNYYEPYAVAGDYTIAPTQSMNYIHSITPRTPMADVSFTGIHNPYQVSENIQYFDGLGRPVQSVQVAGSPTGQSIIQGTEYDEYGRETHKFMPYTVWQSETSKGGFRPDAVSMTNPSAEVYSYHTGIVPDIAITPYPHAVTVFENSPLNRVLEQGAPGYAWQPGNHTVGFNYRTNTLGTYQDNVIYREYLYNDNWNNASGFSEPSYYAVNELYVTETTDENYDGIGKGSIVVEFKDKQGQVVLKQTFLGSSSVNTYYIYDDFGLLRCVIPPEANGTIAGKENLCFFYNYDDRHRMIAKQVPGAQPVYMAYDDRDRLVATQDGNQRGRNGEYSFTKYDQLNRPVMTGIVKGGGIASQSALQDLVNAEAYLYETFTPSAINWSPFYGYTTHSFPHLEDSDPNYEIYTITYYDEYYFNTSGNTYRYITGGSIDFLTAETLFSQVKGTVTATRTRVPGNAAGMASWLVSVSYYDKYGRVIQTTGDNHLGGLDRVSTQYDFIGQVRKTVQQHSKDSKTSVDHTITQRNEYDHAGRLLETWYKRDGETELLMSAMKYNEQGQLVKKFYHADVASGAGRLSVQKEDYRYNIRGWLTNINDPDNLRGDFFAMDLNYDNATTATALGGTALFNGNISGMRWNTSYDNLLRGYGFTYDNLNRIKKANYGETAGTTYTRNNKYSVTGNDNGIRYDLNGNIKSLHRKNSLSAYIDIMTYNYYGNQLIGVADAGDKNSGFVDGSIGDISNAGNMATWEYLYDANGNMTTDKNKGLNAVEYNNLNLPKKITKGSRTINYYYDAVGIKLRNVTPDKTTDYVGNFVYEGGSLKYIITPEGKLDNLSGAWRHEYNLKDHLGNTRVVFTQTGHIAQVNNYYPFGMTFDRYMGDSDNKFLFQKQELQEELEWYHFKWRMHDPALGRFMCVDPLAEKYSYNSPYAFSENRLMDGIELEGLEYLPLIPTYMYDGTWTDYIKAIDNGVINLFNTIPMFWNSGVDNFMSLKNGTWGQDVSSEFAQMGIGIANQVATDAKNLWQDPVGELLNTAKFMVSPQALETATTMFVGSKIPQFKIPELKLSSATTNFKTSLSLNGAGKGGSGFLQGGKTFTQYKAANGGGGLVGEINLMSPHKYYGTKFPVKVEYHHRFLTQSMQTKYSLPNWMVNNRLNVIKTNTLGHAHMDLLRYRTLPREIKLRLGPGGDLNYNMFGN